MKKLFFSLLLGAVVNANLQAKLVNTTLTLLDNNQSTTANAITETEQESIFNFNKYNIILRLQERDNNQIYAIMTIKKDQTIIASPTLCINLNEPASIKLNEHMTNVYGGPVESHNLEIKLLIS